MANATPVHVPAEGTKLSWSATSGGTYAEVLGIINISPPKPKAASVKTTLLTDSIQGYRPGRIPDMGEVTFRVRFDPTHTAHTDIIALITTPASNNRWWKITYNDGFTTPATDVFQAIVLSWEPDTDEDEKNQEAEVTMQVISTITRTPGVSS